MHSVTDRQTDRQTDGQQAAANSRSYCVAVRSANRGRNVFFRLLFCFGFVASVNNCKLVRPVLESRGEVRTTKEIAHEHTGPTVWNSLSDELRNSDSFDSFKRFMKTVLFSHY